MSGEYKVCSQCNKTKSISEYYLCLGRIRSECKSCTIKVNTAYQRKSKVWLSRENPEERKEYMRDYYSKNKEKFAEYRAHFLDKHPDYFRDYYQSRKER